MGASRMPLRTLGQSLTAPCVRVIAHRTHRIMSGTVKDNIVFSHHYDEEFYNLVLECESYRFNKRASNLHPNP